MKFASYKDLTGSGIDIEDAKLYAAIRIDDGLFFMSENFPLDKESDRDLPPLPDMPMAAQPTRPPFIPKEATIIKLDSGGESMDFRELPNGILAAPRRGNPPEPPEGYQRKEGDDYLFEIIIDDCEHREEKTVKSGCCGSSLKIYCNRDDLYVKRLICKECENA